MNRILPILSLLLLFACRGAVETDRRPVPPALPTVASPTAQPKSTDVSPTRLYESMYDNSSIVIGHIDAPPGGGGASVLSREITALPRFLADALYDSLARINPTDGSLQPGLAETWLVSDDARTVVFILREGVKWHDGAPLTSTDVAWTIKTLSDPRTRLVPAADWGPLVRVEAPDARTVAIEFGEPYCAAVTYLATLKILPRHILEGKDLTSLAPSNWVGTGPLILKQWRQDALLLRANPAYWGGSPKIADWTYRLFADETQAWSALQAGEVDLLFAGTDAPPERLSTPPERLSTPPERLSTPPERLSTPPERLSTPPEHLSTPPAHLFDTTPANVSRRVGARNAFYGLAFNLTRAPLDEPPVRQALAMALDRAALTQRVAGEDAVALETSMLPSFWAYPRGIAQPPFDLARAQQLLTGAGWRDQDGDGIRERAGQPLELTLWLHADDGPAVEAAHRLREQFARIGLRAILKPDERTLFLTRLFLQEYDMALVEFNIPLDPDQHYFWDSAEKEPGYGLNVTAYANPRADDLLKMGNRVAQCEPRARARVYNDLQRLLAADLPMIFLFAPSEVLVTHERIRGLSPSPFAGIAWNLNQWTTEP